MSIFCICNIINNGNTYVMVYTIVDVVI